MKKVVAVDSYLNKNGFTLQNENISSNQSLLNSEISRINNVLNNSNGKISLVDKTLEQIKNETIDLREIQ